MTKWGHLKVPGNLTNSITQISEAQHPILSTGELVGVLLFYMKIAPSPVLEGTLGLKVTEPKVTCIHIWVMWLVAVPLV